MFKRSYYVAFGLVFLVALVALNLPERASHHLKLAFGACYLPLFGFAGSAQAVADRLGGLATSRGALLRQNEALRKDNHALRLRLAQLEETARENDRLRQALSWRPRVPWQVRPARVIGHDPANWWQSLHIDLGRRDGVRPNLPVLTADGLVGRVAEVGVARSRVALVGDPSCRVAGQVQETREKGVLLPNASSLNRLVIDFTYLPTTASFQPGHTVLTSGDGGIFPAGIPVGVITEVRTNEPGLFREARVRLAVNLNRLEEVWVMLP
jgi:rod shape-determining protein MreC